MELYKDENQVGNILINGRDISIYKTPMEYGYDIGVKFIQDGKEFGTFVTVNNDDWGAIKHLIDKII